jgi:hypothetical protein
VIVRNYLGWGCHMGPPLRPINRHYRHSKSIMSVSKRRWFIPRPRGGPLHLPTTIPTKTNVRNRPSTASGARIRSVQVKRRWIIGPTAPPHPAVPIIMGQRPQSTSLTYKRSLTPTESNTMRWSISFPLFCSFRV